MLTSCTKNEDEDDIIILIKTTPDKEYYNSGETVIYEVNSFANNGYVNSVNITSVAPDGVNRIFDTLINNTRTTFYFLYKVPMFADSLQTVKLIFTGVCSTGNSSKMTSVLQVVSEDIPLEEHGQFTLYSSASSNKNGFSIELEQTVFSVIDSAYCDIFDYTLPSSDVLSREWRSKTNVLFARFNDFNYASATKRSVMSAYENANKTSVITDIATDDIIFVGRGNTALGVLKVMAVYDDEGCESDRYNFYLKKIEN